MIEIYFLEPSHLHPGSYEITVADLGRILEKKYGLISLFIDYIDKPLRNKLATHLFKYGSKGIHRIEQWIQAEWRNFIVSELHHIRTKAAEKESRESFIQTGSYYRSLQVLIKFT